MMGAAGSAHIHHFQILGLQMMCVIDEEGEALLFFLRVKTPQSQNLASHRDHLCSSSWLFWKEFKKRALREVSKILNQPCYTSQFKVKK